MKYKDQSVYIAGNPVRQINKTTAKKLYDEGTTIYMHPCNMTLNNLWQRPFQLDNSSGEKFSTMLSEYEYYNCCSERGNYANFFTDLKK